ncbi:hypothetical protein Y1Q_0020856 [Alligator mississippiensis]|uniref:Uncharacterized protein n=1 Tax=Alligator mississippiensis TaxID=8496 RepID=A0A151NJX4_ALLMI|nr:hypothetical protein Y1Q_0020856 [Alligator mississippiensis]
MASSQSSQLDLQGTHHNRLFWKVCQKRPQDLLAAWKVSTKASSEKGPRWICHFSPESQKYNGPSVLRQPSSC